MACTLFWATMRRAMSEPVHKGTFLTTSSTLSYVQSWGRPSQSGTSFYPTLLYAPEIRAAQPYMYLFGTQRVTSWARSKARLLSSIVMIGIDLTGRVCHPAQIVNWRSLCMAVFPSLEFPKNQFLHTVSVQDRRILHPHMAIPCTSLVAIFNARSLQRL